MAMMDTWVQHLRLQYAAAQELQRASGTWQSMVTAYAAAAHVPVPPAADVLVLDPAAALESFTQAWKKTRGSDAWKNRAQAASQCLTAALTLFQKISQKPPPRPEPPAPPEGGATAAAMSFELASQAAAIRSWMHAHAV